MTHLVVINLGVGGLQSGCANVIAQVSNQQDRQYPMQYVASLPPAPELEQLYRRWQLLYREFYRERGTRSITISSIGITHFSEVEFSDLAQQLKHRLNLWLNAEQFHPIDRKLSRLFDPTDAIRVIIETNDPILRRLPWHLWNFFEDFPNAEVALSVAEYERVPIRSHSAKKLRILAVLGNSDRINVQRDRAAIEALPNAASVILTEPDWQELHEHLWDQRGWDILFFAGHSQTEEDTGRLFINSHESLTIDQLRNALKRAIRHGLKLAVFNSCDGLGLAQALADLQIPQVIVMRELVPDAVAQTFFREFLTRFASGHSLYAAVREAREKLEKLEGDYPCATWLPLICQNPAEMPIEWQSQAAPVRWRPLRLPILLASLLVTVGTIALRSLGGLQALELRSFDAFMRLRPAEPADSRLLIVTITEEDVQRQNAQERRGASLSDRALSQLLSKLQPHQPRVIGLDLYRDFPIDPASGLRAQLQQTPQFVAVCEVGAEEGTKPLEGIASDRLSFSDMPIDPDGVVRRQILGMAAAPDSFCVTDISFSFRLAQLYLTDQGIQTKRDENGTVQIGETRFPPLRSDSGGYHQLDALGYQVMLNYRAAHPPAAQVPLGEILSGSLDAQLADLVRDRIVVIGTVAPSFKDYFLTPYSQADPLQKLPGIVVQAQMTSQILSTVLDRRPLLVSLPAWGVVLWVWGWAGIGGGLALFARSPLRFGLAGTGAIATLGGISYVCLLQGVWLPIVPAAIALVAASSAVTIYIFSQSSQLKRY
ncbi:MAG: CHASE2 domain-containing protein [Leptolyngbyaceae cyanobacterium SM1_3_5]|nr:CHASE2 domain-containing protein [Leptolyngbyaceae cyanobacterium SM1_3_5]